MRAFDKLKTTASNVYTDLTLHWKTPAQGNYVSYKEILNYSIGGMGKDMANLLINYLALSAGNTLLGSTIGIRPMHLQYMSIIVTLLNVIAVAIRSKLVDNTRTRLGRFCPYLAISGVPLVLVCVVYLFLPLSTYTYLQKLIATFVFSSVTILCAPFLNDSYTELGSVITPNSQERTKILTISSLIYSFAPTVYNLFIPILLSLVDDINPYTNINSYRYVIAPFGLLGVGLIMFAAFGVKERVVTSKTYVQKVKIGESVRDIFKNKYWWIRNIATIIGFAESAFAVLFGWMYIYGNQNMALYGVLLTVYGSASGIAMVITPYLLKKLGNRNVLIWHNALNIVFVLLMVLVFRSPLLYFGILYINTVVNQLALVYNPSMHAEVKDYQQYLTGKRVDFVFGVAGQITLPLTLATSLLIPYVYELMGLTTNYNVLYDPLIRNNLFKILCTMSVVGAVLNLIPFFFYRLSREKHRLIILCLKYRALLQDYEVGGRENVSARDIKEVVEGLNRAYSYRDMDAPNMKAALMEIVHIILTPAKGLAAKTEKKAKRKAAFAKYEELRHIAYEKEAYEEILNKEMQKFEQPLMKVKLNLAYQLLAYEMSEIGSIDTASISFPEDEGVDSSAYARFRKKYSSKLEKMRAVVSEKYSSGTTENYELLLNNAINLPEEDKEAVRAKDKLIKEYENKLLDYNEDYAPYLTARSLVQEYESRRHLDEIHTFYDEAVEIVTEEQRLADEEERRMVAERKERLEQDKQARFATFSPEKQQRIIEKRGVRAKKQAAREQKYQDKATAKEAKLNERIQKDMDKRTNKEEDNDD